jgi:malate dehydrogenase (oxaloacetate-decarboxylating)(NADP+)
VPDEVAAAYSGRRLRYGREYVIPVPFDPRLISAIPANVAAAAAASGVAQKPIADIAGYRRKLSARLDPTASSLQVIHEQVRASPKRVIFAEGEEEVTIRAALSYRNIGYGTPVLIGREEPIREAIARLGLTGAEDLEIHNARLSKANKTYTDFLYGRLQRKGFLYRDCQRLVNQNRNVFAACMMMHGEADAMVTGQTRNSSVCFDDVRHVLDPEPDAQLFGVSIVVARGRTVFMADTAVHDRPDAAQLAHIAERSAAMARAMGHEPRVAFVSYSNFGNPPGAPTTALREAVALLDARKTDFEYDGEMAADVALDPDLRAAYPFIRLSGPANVLVMAGLHAASAASQMLQKLGGASIIGPLLMGFERPAQIVSMGATVSDLVNHAALAAHQAIAPPAKKTRARKKADAG